MIRVLLAATLIVTVEAAPALPGDQLIATLPEDLQSCFGGYAPSASWATASAIKWNPLSEVLPLNPETAKKIACDKLKEHLKKGEPIDVWSTNVRLVQIEGSWIYTIGVSFWWKGRTMAGTPLWGCVHVRLDGAALVESTPLVTERPKGLLESTPQK